MKWATHAVAQRPALRTGLLPGVPGATHFYGESTITLAISAQGAKPNT